MQSHEQSPAKIAEKDLAAVEHLGCLTIFVAVVPVFGIVAELMTGMLSDMLPLFPSWWHVGAVVLAVVANFALHIGAFDGSRRLLVRAGATGFTLGMALLYALAEAPAIPAMLAMSVVGLGILAAAPYFVLMGMGRLLPKLWRDWHASGRTSIQLAWILLVLGVLPLATEVVNALSRNAIQSKLTALAEVMELDGASQREESLAANLRALDIDTQRSICVMGSRGANRANWLLGQPAGGRRGHLANGVPFWFAAQLATSKLLARDARRAFHRAHGEAFDDGVMPDEVLDTFVQASLEWRKSLITAWVEPEAALAKVDWEIEVSSRSQRVGEAQFDIRLPTGAVASSLSLWISGIERPAAFAAASEVEEAFESIVAKMRDPALLQEIGPDLVRLRLFPVSDATPMHVRIGLTVPLCLRGGKALLQLPQVVGHNCGLGRLADHMVRIHGVGDAQTVPYSDEQLALAIEVPLMDRVICAPDADGFVVQQLLPRPAVRAIDDRIPYVVVLEASSSVARVIPDPTAFLREWICAASPETARRCIVFLVVGKDAHRLDLMLGGDASQNAFLQRPFAGGVDARRALLAAIKEAQALGQPRVYWLHGAMAEWQSAGWQAAPNGVEVAALALDAGRNVLRDIPWLRKQDVTVPRLGSTIELLRSSLQDFERFHIVGETADFGDTERRLTRASTKPAGAVQVSDQLARMWAARKARELVVKGRDEEGAQLAARYRLVTAGSGAVVLESSEQYEQYGLEPGAAIGREPDSAIGSLPIAEPSTFILLGSGLLVIMWWKRRRNSVKRATAL
ncbi:MAG: hypothetical protein ACI89X_001983 [Planctomycetota bacterium]|jgi:hypothetical protein